MILTVPSCNSKPQSSYLTNQKENIDKCIIIDFAEK